MEEKYDNDAEKRQTEQEWENIDNRQYFETIGYDDNYKNNESESITEDAGTKRGSEEAEIREDAENGNNVTSEGSISFNSTAVMSRKVKILLVISWISAALTAFVSVYFAIPGILFGIFSNRIARGSANAAIITNIVLAIVNIILGFFMVVSLRKLFVLF